MAAEVGRRAEDLRCNIVQLLRVKTAREVISLGKCCLSQKESLIISIAPTLLQMKIAKTSDKKRKSKENNLETSISTITSLPSQLWPWPLLGTTILELEERVPVKVPLSVTLSIPMTGHSWRSWSRESTRLAHDAASSAGMERGRS
jgi:hypothetical protein